MHNPLSSLPVPQLLRVMYCLSEQLEWKFKQDDDKYLQDQALAATRYHKAICSNCVEIFHSLPVWKEAGGGKKIKKTMDGSYSWLRNNLILLEVGRGL